MNPCLALPLALLLVQLLLIVVATVLRVLLAVYLTVRYGGGMSDEQLSAWMRTSAPMTIMRTAYILAWWWRIVLLRK